MNTMLVTIKTAALQVATMSPLSRSAGRAAATKLGIAGAILSLVAACSPAPMPISQSSRDASNPSAPEGVSPVLSASATPMMPAEISPHHHDRSEDAPAAANSVHEGHGAAPAASDAGAQGVVYVCPMHPEVTSNAAGICPKCNMKLVPKK